MTRRIDRLFGSLVALGWLYFGFRIAVDVPSPTDAIVVALVAVAIAFGVAFLAWREPAR